VDGVDEKESNERRVGRVVAVSASRAMALLERQDIAPLELGNVVKMPTRTGTVYGMVIRLEVSSGEAEPSEGERTVAEIEFAGEIADEDGEAAAFRPGTSAFPVLEAAVWLATPVDLQKIYARPDVASAQIGSLHQDSRIPAYILTDELLARHFSIVGSTSSGKSCLVTAILGSVLRATPQGHVVLLDPHGEYSNAFGEHSAVLSPGSGLYFPYWLFNFEELTEIILGSEPQPHHVKILGEAVLAAKNDYFGKSGLQRQGTVDTPAPYRIADVLSWIDFAMGALNPTESIAAYRTVIARITALQSDARYGFVFNTRMTLRDELCDILAQLFRIPVAGKPITILDLAGVPSEVVNVIVSVICRLAFDFALWSDNLVPITIICEEAHRYAPRDKMLGFEGAKRALFRVAKEGRKYGVSLGVVSQRPSDLAPGLLSECSTMFAFRMTDQEDQAIVRSAAPESCYGLLNFLPALRTAETIAIGEGVSLPMRIRLAPLPPERRPKSASALFSEAWTREIDGRRVEEAVANWRRGARPSG
jgi:DNA helicase HerA-like ATPase